MADQPSVYVPSRVYTIADRSGVDDLEGHPILAGAEYMLTLRVDDRRMALLFSDRDLADQYLEAFGDDDYAVATFAGDSGLLTALIRLRDEGVGTVVFDAPPKGKNYNAVGFPIQRLIDQVGGTSGQGG